MAEFFRSYAFLDKSSFILTTNSGKVYLGTLSSAEDARIATSKLIAQIEDLTGYSVCAGVQSLGVAFVAGSKGSLYAYIDNSPSLIKLHTVDGKIGEMFTASYTDSLSTTHIILLITLVGQKSAQLLDVVFENGSLAISQAISVPISDLLTGLVITSMVHVDTNSEGQFVLLGFRRGSVAAYRVPKGDNSATSAPAELLSIIEGVHQKEAVTAMLWFPDSARSSSGHLVSTGRDGCLSIHYLNLAETSVSLVHNLTLPIGPNIEGLCLQEGHLHVYGFSSKKFVLYNTNTEEEIMSVETGGAHRSWAFQPRLERQGGGTLVWTRASSMHIYSQNQPNHQVIRSGGHGREIKAVAVTNTFGSMDHRQLIATGAEDTDIKIFEYQNQHLVCRRTLRKHTTGIQHLQWSTDGTYLFSSGGCEEFYIWRVCHLPLQLGGIGVRCESACKPESEHSDLRIMTFDVLQRDGVFVISMVFSNSCIKLYTYTPTTPQKCHWHLLAQTTYSTSCLTQCVFLSPTTVLTAGTDGHAVLWDIRLPPSPSSSSFSSNPNHPTHSHPASGSLTSHNRTPIHQNTSKTLTTHVLPDGQTLIVSGGDDGSLAFLLVSPPPSPPRSKTETAKTTLHPPTVALLPRAHPSAITACTILPHNADSETRLFLLTAGNDQWLRLWEIVLPEVVGQRQRVHGDTVEVATGTAAGMGLDIRRVKRVRTSVADVSCVAVLAGIGDEVGARTRVVLCGVGMEVLRVLW